MIFGLFVILQSLAISLGVGASTLAVTNFFVAIWDGDIDENERRMMGVVYVVLRVAMVAILFTTLVISVVQYTNGEDISTLTVSVWTLLAVLFINAALMAIYKIPSSFGPAIQISAWYTLGLLMSFALMSVTLSYIQFLLLYLTMLFFSVAFINILLMYCKHCQKQKGINLPQ